MRMNICEPVAMPRSLRPTEAWIATRNVVFKNPMAMPSRKAPVTGNNIGLVGSIESSTRLPASRAAPPIRAVFR